MKNYITFGLLLLLSSCMYHVDYEKANDHVHLSNYLVKITSVNVTKYSYVNAVTTYKGKEYVVSSTNGYYYKEYKLKPGDEIYVDLDVYFFKEKNDENNSYDDVTELIFKPLDLTKYEIKK